MNKKISNLLWNYKCFSNESEVKKLVFNSECQSMGWWNIIITQLLPQSCKISLYCDLSFRSMHPLYLVIVTPSLPPTTASFSLPPKSETSIPKIQAHTFSYTPWTLNSSLLNNQKQIFEKTEAANISSRRKLCSVYVTFPILASIYSRNIL